MGKSILAVQLNSAEASKFSEAAIADTSSRKLAGEGAVMYVKRTGHKVWEASSPLYEHFASAITEAVLKGNPTYSNTRVLVKYARDTAETWYIAEGDPELKAARDAAEAAKAEVKTWDGTVAQYEAQTKREDITVGELKQAKLDLAEVKAQRGLAKATASRLAGEYVLAYESKFPVTVKLLSKQDKLDAFVKAVKGLKSTFDALEDGSVDKYVHEATKGYLDKMSKWTEVKSDKK